MKSIPIYLSPDHPCSYLEGQVAQSAFVHPNFQHTPSSYRVLLEHGFRRSGSHVYTPYCNHCNACIPVRIPVSAFHPNRSQKRAWKKNKETKALIKPPVFDPKHFRLYQKYQQTRHPDSTMAESTKEDYMSFLTSRWCDTRFVEFHLEQQLISVAVVDCVDKAWSAVYTFFDPDFSAYSPGVYAVLWEIEQAKQEQLDWLYLGFWIEDCRKMAYKNQYRPIQHYFNNNWTNLE